MKNLKYYLSTMVICAASYMGYMSYEKVNMTDEEIALMENVEALSSVEWENKRLEIVECICSNGKKGNTFRCTIDGALEKCSETQQGSNACYKVGFARVTLCS